jgi:Tfp pilus assembly protein PilN
LFDTLDRERSTVMDGIERFTRKRRDNAARIRAEATELRAEQSAPNPDQTKIEDLTNRINWDTRIFEAERKTISYVCEVPQSIEQRLFALSRAIQQSLD